jgi:subtilisin family serine protease
MDNSLGNGVVVAVLDSGIDTAQSDLADCFFTNSNEIANSGIDDDDNGYVDDICGWDFFDNDDSINDIAGYNDQWHGTHIAGIIAAVKDNNIGIAGVAPESIILPLKIFENGIAYTSDIINAISYAESMGAEIINCSWSSRFNNPALEDAISNSDALFVCAAGNNLYNLDNYPVYPAAYSTTHNNVISVAAIDQSGKLCRFSNYGQNTIDIAAPGQGIVSTWINGEYQSVDGTSMSAAYVSGAAALVFSDGIFSNAGAVKERLISAADTVYRS